MRKKRRRMNADTIPHIWLDPVLAKQQVNNIRDGPILADPAGEKVYRLNAIAYNAELDGFDGHVRDELSECQLDTFVLFHNAFAYFVRQYDLGVFALGGASPESEVAAAEIVESIAFVRDNGIGAVFAEDLTDPASRRGHRRRGRGTGGDSEHA